MKLDIVYKTDLGFCFNVDDNIIAYILIKSDFYDKTFKFINYKDSLKIYVR
jgi:hypothetical protein